MEMITFLFKLFILSILLHIIDDFVLQPICLSRLKQKKTWLDHEDYSDKYKDDYKMALFIHSLSWSIMVMIPLLFVSSNIFFLLGALLINTTIHYTTDDNKANKFKINLIQDQLIHFAQIIFMYIIFGVIVY